jgi:hypothetical protein
MKSYVVREDVEQWEPLIAWLAQPSGARATASSGSTPAALAGA